MHGAWAQRLGIRTFAVGASYESRTQDGARSTTVPGATLRAAAPRALAWSVAVCLASLVGCTPEKRPCATDIDCIDGNACTTNERCDSASRTCADETLDGDGDGAPPSICGGDDCDDSDGSRFPGAREFCNGRDDDCDGSVDEGASSACGPSETCSAGRCQCARGMVFCGGSCADLVNDPENCGACGATCTPGTCAASVCGCPAGLTSCTDATGGSYCADTENSPTDCGGCGLRGGTRCVSGMGACTRSGLVSLCVAGALACDAVAGAPSAETCNGLDDDCDGTVDDGNPDSGTACVVGVGACARTGSLTCASGSLACIGTPGTPTVETCNGRDDDCDGSIDEGVTPSAEVCNGLDDDCNGAVDDGLPAGATCSVGVGACARSGALWCTDGTYSACDAVPGAAAVEICNSLDDDCNGLVDEGLVGCAVVELSAGDVHTCARRGSGAVACWGFNNEGELGDGTYVTRTTATRVSSLTDAAAISTGSQHSCALRASGAVVCWGRNYYGQLGDGTTALRPAPTAVTGLTDAVELSAGDNHTCARRASGAVVCWGRNASGQLGDGTLINRLLPTPVSGLTDAVELSAGGLHTCARRASGAVVCWGGNGSGQLGDGTTTGALTPTPVSGLTDAVELSTGYVHSCARRASGAVACWGDNSRGELGDGTGLASATPTPVTGLSDAVELSCGTVDSCARTRANTLVCWGAVQEGGLGDALAPIPMPGVADIVEISVGGGHICVRLASGSIACWGNNSRGQLGDGTYFSRFTFAPASGF